MSNIEPTSDASSLEVLKDGWVIFYSESMIRGSELYVKGPYYIDDLSKIKKLNKIKILGDGDWDDEIASFRYVKERPNGYGTLVPEQPMPAQVPSQQPPPPASACPSGSSLISLDGYLVYSENGLTTFRLYNNGCTEHLIIEKTADVLSKTGIGIKCHGSEVFKISICRKPN